MKIRFILVLIFFACSANAQLEIGHMSSYRFIAPTPNIQTKTQESIARHANYIVNLDVQLFRCGLVIVEKEPEVQLSLRYIGTRETWIPITGRVKKENFYRVN